MPWWCVVLAVLCSALLLLLIAACIVLFSPLVFIVDSQQREFRFRWLALLEFCMPLPGGESGAALRVAGKAVPIRSMPRPLAPSQEHARKPPAPKKPSRFPAGFAWSCLRNSAIRRSIARQLARMFGRILGAFKLQECRGGIFLLDPALNGMVSGVLAATNRGRAGAVRVNFTGENSLRCELRLYPFRVAAAGARFLFGIPYLAFIREWRRNKLSRVRGKRSENADR